MGNRKKTEGKEKKSRKPEKKEELWFVLDCAEDDSVCLISEPSVIFGEDVQVGDCLKFYMTPGSKKTFEGLVVDFSVDYDAMLEKQSAKNADKKKLAKEREDSFHEDRARKSAVASRKVVQEALGLKKEGVNKGSAIKRKKIVFEPSSSDSDNDNNNNIAQSAHDGSSDDEFIGDILKKQGTKKDKLSAADMESEGNDVNPDLEKSGDHENSCESSDSDITPQQIELLKKYQKKMTRRDSVLLKNMPSTPKPSTSFSSIGYCKVISKPKPQVRENSDGSGSDEERKQTESQPSHARATPPKCKESVPKKKPKVAVEKTKFNGTMFNNTHPVDPQDTSVVSKLYKQYDVFVNMAELDTAKSRSSTPTAYARKLLPLVFTDEARYHCSITGGPASGKGKLAATTRPPLDEAGVNAILLAVKSRCKKKQTEGFPSYPGDSVIRQKLASKLCEERASLGAVLLKRNDSNETL